MPPRPTDLELIGGPPMPEGKLQERVEYIMNARPKLWFRQPANTDLSPALATQSERPHGTMHLKEMNGATFTKVDLYVFPEREDCFLNTIKSIYAYILFVAMTSLFSQHPHAKDGKTWLLSLQCLDYEHLQSWISMLVSWAVLHKVGCTVPYQIHAEISCPMSGDDYSTATLKTWAFLIQAIDEAGDSEDAVVGIPKRVTIDINKAVIPAFEDKVLRAVLPVDVGDDAEYEVDLVDDTTPI